MDRLAEDGCAHALGEVIPPSRLALRFVREALSAHGAIEGTIEDVRRFVANVRLTEVALAPLRALEAVYCASIPEDIFGSSRIIGEGTSNLHEKEFAIPVISVIPITVRRPLDDFYSIVYSSQLTSVRRHRLVLVDVSRRRLEPI